MTEYKNVEQQIASLAARVDPDAFNRDDDQTLQGRRRAAVRGWLQSRSPSKVHKVLAASAVALVCAVTVGVYIMGG